MPHNPLLRIDGEVEQTLDLSFDDLRSLPAADQVPDISRFHPKRRGDGVTLDSLLRRARPTPSATYLTVHATADNFAASVPLAAIRAEAVVVYRLADAPLPLKDGGPVRFIIRNPAACHTDELDDCANVKFVDRLELTPTRGRDTRPQTTEEHKHLHSNSPS